MPDAVVPGAISAYKLVYNRQWVEWGWEEMTMATADSMKRLSAGAMGGYLSAECIACGIAFRLHNHGFWGWEM